MAVPLRARGITLGLAIFVRHRTAGALRRGRPAARRGDRRPGRGLRRQRPPLHPRAPHRPDPAAQPAARSALPAAGRRRGRLPLPARRLAGRGRRRLVRRDPAVRRPGRPGRRRRRRPRHPRLGHHGPAAHRRPHPRRRRPRARRTAHPPGRPRHPPGPSGRPDDAEARGRASGESGPPACTPSTTRSPAAAPWPAPVTRRPRWSTPDGTAAFLDLPPGPPLGLGGLPFEAAEIDLPEGSVLALYTDGLIEAARPRHRRRARRCCARRSRGPDRPLEETCDAVLRSLLPDRPADDVALLLARTRALGRRPGRHLGRSRRPRAVGRRPQAGQRSAGRLGAGGASLRHRTGRQRAGHQRHPLRRAPDPAAADPRRTR